jgi:CRP-like cAMP-binding protein
VAELAKRMADWDTISSLLREALSRETNDRDAFLDDACAGNLELRRQIGSLLELAAPSGTVSWLNPGVGRRAEEQNSATDRSKDSTLDRTVTDGMTDGVLFKSSPFSILGADTLSDLFSVMHLREFAAGEHLIRQGDPAEFLLFILSGYASARVRDTPGDRPPIGAFGPGDIVGEMSLVTDQPRTADVVARTLVRSLQLSASDFHVLADRHPDLRAVLTEVVTERLGHSRHDGLGGKDIHGYQIIQCVGRGGMGVVYEATHLATGRQVALKMMNHRLIYQLSALRRFRREASILATLEHPSLARLYECFSAYKTEFLAMEFCQGRTLSQAIRVYGALKEDVVRRMLGQLAAALMYVHGRGIVHRDVKPSNIVLTRTGAIKLLDFGIVNVEKDSDLWQTLKTTSHPAGLLGTPRYMAPEQFSDRVADRRADFYSLACVVFEALSGRPVAAASDVFDIIREHAHFVLPSRDRIGTGISQEMYEVLLRGLEHNPDQRSLDLERLVTWAAPLELSE